MRESKISKSYAKSYFDLSREEGFLEAAHNDMKLIHEVCISNKDFRLFLRNPIIKPKKKQIVISEIFGKQIEKLSLAFLDIIVKNSREEYIEGIAKGFIDQYRKYKNIKTAYLKTAVKIDDDMLNRIKEILEKQTSADIDLIEEIDENIIGGFILSVDDKQFDASILFKMKKLIKEFEQNIYIRKF
ncbi:ATP synthase F1 subunit delta [candidate division KSB1 bacterium]